MEFEQNLTFYWVLRYFNNAMNMKGKGIRRNAIIEYNLVWN